MGERLKTKPGDATLGLHHVDGTEPSKVVQGLHNVPPLDKNLENKPVTKILKDKHQK